MARGAGNVTVFGADFTTRKRRASVASRVPGRSPGPLPVAARVSVRAPRRRSGKARDRQRARGCETKLSKPLAPRKSACCKELRRQPFFHRVYRPGRATVQALVQALVHLISPQKRLRFVVVAGVEDRVEQQSLRHDILVSGKSPQSLRLAFRECVAKRISSLRIGCHHEDRELIERGLWEMSTMELLFRHRRISCRSCRWQSAGFPRWRDPLQIVDFAGPLKKENAASGTHTKRGCSRKSVYSR